MNLNRSTVLILSSTPDFARAITESWPGGADRPEFTLLEQDLGHALRRDSYDLAIADASRPEPGQTSGTGIRPAALIAGLASTGKPAIVVHADCSPGQDGCGQGSTGSILHICREQPSWAELVGLIGREILRRTQAELRARQFEEIRAAAEADATLGRYMVEMYHSVNNALTSVLGNAELLALEPGLPATVQAQADTIRNMALRLNEVFRRFSSIEKELSVKAREIRKPGVQARA